MRRLNFAISFFLIQNVSKSDLRLLYFLCFNSFIRCWIFNVFFINVISFIFKSRFTIVYWFWRKEISLLTWIVKLFWRIICFHYLNEVWIIIRHSCLETSSYRIFSSLSAKITWLVTISCINDKLIIIGAALIETK